MRAWDVGRSAKILRCRVVDRRDRCNQSALVLKPMRLSLIRECGMDGWMDEEESE
jgi:hypothetical protein